jgi:signal transduction histidine kinase
VRSIFRRSITIRTLLVGGVLAALLGAVFAVLVVAVREQQAAGRLALRSQQAIGAGSALETSLVNLENGVRGYVASGRERLLEPFRTARRTYPAQAERLSRLVADEPRQQAAVRQITTGINDYVALWALPLVGLADDRREVAQSVLATGTGRERLDTLRSELATLFARERSVAAERERRADRRSDTAVILGLIGMGLVALVALGMWLGLRRSILRPVERVALATRAVADGDLTVHVPADREDEIGTLARSFNDMTDALNRSHQQLDTRTRDLERSNHDLEQYAQMASHDLQAPLATIDLYLRLIERRLPDASQEELVQLLEGVGGSTDRMRSLVRDLLHLARVGRGEPKRETLETREVLDRALENLAGPIEERGAHVSAGPLPLVSGDPSQLSLLFQNLLGNAIKFSDHDAPRVSVTASIEGAEAQFAVRDNGIGIDPQHAERIFQPFQRLHGEDRYEGTGIGLAICQRIVSHHGGRIWAESTVGAGSTFRFTLPLGVETPPPPAPPTTTHQPETSHAAAA